MIRTPRPTTSQQRARRPIYHDHSLSRARGFDFFWKNEPVRALTTSQEQRNATVP